jgi:DNA-binding MarR family transcriptional regulator
VVAAVNHLQSRALITRSIDAQDRRRNTIALTAAGDEELVRLHHVVAGVQDALLAHLAPRDRTALNRLLRRLNDPPG